MKLKKVILKTLLISAVVFVGPGRSAFAGLTDIEGTILDHVQPVTMVGRHTTSVGMVDSVVLIGSFNGEHVGSIQAGFKGDVNNPSGINWIAGGHVRLDPFFKTLATLPDYYQFLKSVQYGPALYYDFSNKVWIGRINVGLSFGLTPQK